MDFVPQPWQFYVVILAGWINRQQQEVINYLRTENQVLRETHGKKQILLNDDQRRRLAVKGKILGRKRLEEVGTLFTPDTILRWHRMLVAKKWDYSETLHSDSGPLAFSSAIPVRASRGISTVDSRFSATAALSPAENGHRICH